MRVIVLAGPGRVGKTTIANELSRHIYEAGFIPKILPFAKPLKDAAAAAGFPKDTHPQEYREYCQREGAERRAENPNHWVDLWREAVDEVLDREGEGCTEYGEHVIIVDDCRYYNEKAAPEGLKAVYIFIHPGDRELPEADAEWRNHESEEMADAVLAGTDDQWHYHFYNDEDLDALKEYIAEVAETWYDCWSCDCAVCVSLQNDEPCTAEGVLDELARTMFLEEPEDDD